MIIHLRNSTLTLLYKYILKPILFQFDPEKVHTFFVKTGKLLGSNIITKSLTSLLFNYQNPILYQKIKDIDFKNPIGLSAGFDKNAELTGIIPEVGFGFEEGGSITANQCSGNKGIRLKRITEKNSLWINLGLNNEGVEKIHNRIAGRKLSIPLGISIAKTNCKETANPEKAIEDYLFSIKKITPLSSFIVINISCPNAYGGQPFTEPRLFEKLMFEVYKLKIKKPIFIKMSPDLRTDIIDKIITISEKYGVSGFVCSNLTKSHEFQNGGISGKMLEEKSNSLISYIYRKTKGKFIIIGAGGVFSTEDAYKKIKLGASLIELITGMIYEGPALISSLNLGLVKLLKKDGYNNISEAIGKDCK